MEYSTTSIRPNRITGIDGKKGEDYDLAWANYIVSRIFDWRLTFFRTKTDTNWMFLLSNYQMKWQWMLDEDIDTFLNDESGQPNGRVRWQDNIMAPVLRQYVGNAIRTSFEYRAEPLSESIQQKRDEEMSKMMIISQIAQEMGGMFKDILQDQFPIGEGPEDAERLFDGYYFDTLTRDVNNLIKVVADRNDLNGKLKKWLTKQLCASGLCVAFNKEHFGHQVFEGLDSRYFFWDVSAQKDDLSDSMYMGHKAFLDPTYIYEKYPDLTNIQREEIEKIASYQNNGDQFDNGLWTGDQTGRVSTYYAFWRDIEEHEYGVVSDEMENELFVRINYEGGKYEDKDLIVATDEKYKKILGQGSGKNRKNKKKRKFNADVVRYCVFVYDISSSAFGEDDDMAPIVLESGIMPYQETTSLDPSSAKFPYSVQTFEYWNGMVVSPLDSMIDPQRMINRFWSAQEHQVNRAVPPVTLIDRGIIDEEEGEEGLRRNIRNGDPVLVNGKFGLNNAVANIPGTRLDGFEYLSAAIGQVKSAALAITGVNEQMLGTGSLELVRNNQAMINRGTLIQEDFYFSLADCMKQMYQSIANRGRKIYADSPHTLINAVGDEGAERISFTADDLLADFRISLQRSEPEKELINQGNVVAMQLLQMGMLDENTLSKVLNLCTPAEVYSASRRYLKMKQEILRQQEEAMAAQGQAMEAQAQEQQIANQMLQLEQMERADANMAENRDAKLLETMMKSEAQMASRQQPRQQMNQVM
jgi:hypothetical protein